MKRAVAVAVLAQLVATIQLAVLAALAALVWHQHLVAQEAITLVVVEQVVLVGLHRAVLVVAALEELVA
jgi:hypothetical protein